jgi:FkbM family methyltransferase
MENLIYDIGSNNGDDIPYYLLKADTVIAVEANPALCKQIRSRFSAEIATNRLIVENIVVTSDDVHEVDFWIHNVKDHWSTMDEPHHDIASYTKVRLPSKSISELFNQYGSPLYVKIDIEGADELIIRELFRNGIYPPYLSVEAHTVGLFGVLMAIGNYRHFKLVDGAEVHTRYASTMISDNHNSSHVYSFPLHSAGPFGDDIHGHWMDCNTFLRYFSYVGAGWKDIHVTNLPVDHVGDYHCELNDVYGAHTRWLVRVTILRIFNRISRLIRGLFIK